MVVIQPQRHTSIEIRKSNSQLLRTIHEPLMVVDEQFVGAGPGADHQILITIVVEVRPGSAMRVGVRALHPVLDLVCNIDKNAIAPV